MFGKFKRHDNRKQRLSSWFECERDSDTHTFDMGGVAVGLVTYIHAALRDQARKSGLLPPASDVATPIKPPAITP